MSIWSHQTQGRGSTFCLCHALLKKAILHLKRANMPFFLSICVEMLISKNEIYFPGSDIKEYVHATLNLKEKRLEYTYKAP